MTLFACPKADAQTNAARDLFSVHADLGRLVGLDREEPQAHQGGNTNAPVANAKVPLQPAAAQPAPAGANALLDESQPARRAFFREGKILEAVVYYFSVDTISPPLRITSSASSTRLLPGVAGMVKSIPFNVIQAFNLYDPIPVERGPAPSTLPLHEQLRPRSQSEPRDAPILMLGGQP